MASLDNLGDALRRELEAPPAIGWGQCFGPNLGGSRIEVDGVEWEAVPSTGDVAQDGDAVPVVFTEPGQRAPVAVTPYRRHINVPFPSIQPPAELAWWWPGARNHTQAKYAVDVPFAEWELEEGFGILWDFENVIGYTLGGVGYVVTQAGTRVRGHSASDGTQLWEVNTLHPGWPIYNPQRQELIILGDPASGRSTSILNPATGDLVGGPCYLGFAGYNGLGNVAVWGDRLYDLWPPSGYTGDNPGTFTYYRRSGATGYVLGGQTSPPGIAVPGPLHADLSIEGYGFSHDRLGSSATPAGKIPIVYHASARNLEATEITYYLESLVYSDEWNMTFDFFTGNFICHPELRPDPLYYDETRVWDERWPDILQFYLTNRVATVVTDTTITDSYLCLLDLASGACSLVEAIPHADQTWPPLDQSDGIHFHWSAYQPSLTTEEIRDFFGIWASSERSSTGWAWLTYMDHMGNFYGRADRTARADSVDLSLNRKLRAWTPSGGAGGSVDIGEDGSGSIVGPDLGRYIRMNLPGLSPARITSPFGAALWAVPANLSILAGAGEGDGGALPWVLMSNSTTGLAEVRNLASGVLRAPWEGGSVAMVSAGRIYTAEGDGYLRRWRAPG